MGWYVAPSLNKLLAEVNYRFPKRSKYADGSIGDASHSARKSDHNPDWSAGGVVRARDITHDPAQGCDIHREVRDPRILKDPRQKYIISNAKMMSSYPMGGYPAYAERPYYGSNAHRHHAHISIKSGRIYENDTTPWYGASQEEKLDAETKKKFEEQQADLDAIREALGPDYGASLGKALFSVRRDEHGNVVVGPDGKPLYDETLENVDNKVDELAMHVGQLSLDVKNLTVAVQKLVDAQGDG